jgi:hypothetical protein
LAGNLAWLHEVHRKAKYRAESALSQAQAGAGAGLEILQRVEKQTLKEITKGHMGDPWSLRDLIRAHTDPVHGSLKCRVLLLSGVLQGATTEEVLVHPDGHRSALIVQKLRVIDDARLSLHNDLQLHCETICLCDFTYPGLVAQELVKQCRDLSWKYNEQSHTSGGSRRAHKRARRGSQGAGSREFDVP